METDRRNVGLNLLIALLCLVAAGKAILYDTLDPDCFWHMRVADELIQQGIGPIVDHLSFSSIQQPWTPYSWLAELAMRQLWIVGGFRAAILTQAILMGLFVWFVSLCAKELTDRRNPLAVVIATVAAMFLSLPYLSFRPVTFVLVMLALCAWLLLRDRRMNEKSRAIWWIVPIAAVMTNCHFFAILLPMVVGALLIGAFIEAKNVRRYSILILPTTLACLATPMLAGTWDVIWRYQFSDPMVSGGVIAEFQPIWSSPSGFVLVVACAILCFIHRDRLRIGERLWLAGGLILLCRLGRFAPVVAPILAAAVAAALPSFTANSLARRPIVVAIAAVLAMGFFRIAFAIPGADASMEAWLNRHGPDTPGYPTAAADFVAQRVPAGRIINEFTWGGFLEWRLGEQYPVLLDGRTQLFPSAFWKQMYLQSPADAKAVLEKANAVAAVVPSSRSRFKEELTKLGWTSTYRDDRAEVLLPPAMNVSINP